MQRLMVSQLLCLMILLPCKSALADSPAAINPADYTAPVCPSNYSPPKAGVCAPDVAAINALSETACTGAGVAFKAASAAAPASCVPSTPTPVPQCKDLSGYTATLSNGACTYNKTNVSSGSGDYIGDCFTISTIPPGSNLLRQVYFASGQKNLDNGDRDLTLIGAKKPWWSPSCVPDPDSTSGETQVSAGKLVEAGATRVGYTYGALTMPYKYYPGTKTFVADAPIGAYVGLRRGQAGSGYTLALAFTLSSVKANTVDPKTLVDGKPTVTGTTDVAAISLAAGMMFDILKSPSGRPFKAGLFFGVDRVSKSPTVSFPQNGKPWFALQLGYDFTDN